MMKLPFLHWQSVVDFCVLTAVVYSLLHWAKQTRVLRIFLGIGALVAGGSISRRVDLILTAWILHMAAIAGVVMLVLVYHAEIRHALTHLDVVRRFMRGSPVGQTSDALAIAQVAFGLAAAKQGALIVLAGNDALEDMLTGGVDLGGAISREILEAIFRRASPVHDGAVIIQQGRIARVGVFLPLTNREDLPSYYGTRHRAAIGLAEHSNAMVIVCSEERGEVSVVTGASIDKVSTQDELLRQIKEFNRVTSSFGWNWKRSLLGNLGLKLSAVATAGLIWVLVFMTGASVRSFTVPVEFQNVPAGLEIIQPANNLIAMQLRAATWMFSALNEERLVVRFDLSGMGEGPHPLTVNADDINLPPGIFLERAFPQTMTVRLARRQTPDQTTERHPANAP